MSETLSQVPVLILPQIKLKSQLSHAFYFLNQYRLQVDDSDLPDFSKSFKENADLFLSVALMFKKISSDQWRRRQWHPTPVLLPGKSHGQRSLVGCSPWGGEEWDMTERLHFHFSLSCIGEGNGNPLLCSCLENPRDGRAGWAAVYGVAESDMTEST